MVKIRDAHICNVKLLLLLCVVYGHWIEPWIWDSPWRNVVYRLIYLVHMPLFSFLSGLYLKRERACLGTMTRALAAYIPAQTLAMVLSDGTVAWHTPFWHLWYLLSLTIWAGLAYCWHHFCCGRGGLVILLSGVVAGCMAGYLPWLTRVLSGSRTVVFFPYFWLGVLCPRDVNWRGLRRAAVLLPAAMAPLFSAVWKRTGVAFLYHAAPYGTMEHGWALRLGCYGLGVVLGLLLLAWTSGKRMICTWMAGDTLPVYLLHGPVVGVLRQIPLPWWAELVGSMALIGITSILLRWWMRPCGIGERKGGVSLGGIFTGIRSTRKAGLPVSPVADR